MALKGNLVEEVACCSRYQWWRESHSGAARSGYPLSGQTKHYAPDMQFHVRHVKLVIDVEPSTKQLAGTCFTTVEAIARPVSEVFFQAEDMQVTRASIAGGADSLPLEHSQYGVKVTLPKPLNKGEKAEIALDYALQNSRSGIYFTGPESKFGEPYQVWTQGQDEDAHYWFPVAGADFPNHKMTSEVVATVPKRFTAVSNGKLLLESCDEAKGLRTFHWLLDKPHVCYLVALTVGVFVKLEKKYKDLSVQLYCDPEQLEKAKAFFEDSDELVALFSRISGVEYPWPGKYAEMLARKYIFGGMENTTITVLTDRILADDTTFEEYRKAQIRLKAHELKHHWDGDYLTCLDWSHAWLNEGGATYGEVEAMEHFYGLKERDYYVKGLADTYFGEDRKYRRPIVSQFYQEPIDLFDRHLYQKGALVRHMLRYLLGTDGYYASVRTYYTDNAYQSVETSDLIKAIEKTTGRNLREFFDQWVYGAGFPEYEVTYIWDDQQKVATVKVSQKQKLEEKTGLFSMPIVFSFTSADGKTKEYTVYVNDKDTSFHFALDAKPSMFRFDPENWILKTVDLKVPREMLKYQLANDPSVTGRVHAAHALSKLGGADVVSALGAAVASDFFWGVSVEAVRALATIGDAQARELLKVAAAHKLPSVRRAAVIGLGSFKDESVGEFLAAIVDGTTPEKSVFVRSEAAAALGKTGSVKAFDALTAALAVDSWQQVVRVGVLNGLAELGDERGVDIASGLAAAGADFDSRPAALAALGKLAQKHPKAVESLHAIAQTEEAAQFTLRMAAVGAIGQSKHKDSVAVLHRLKTSAYDGRVKRIIAETIETIQSASNDGKAQNEELKRQVEKLTSQVRELTDRVNAADCAQKREGNAA